MQISSYEISGKNDLINYLKHNTVLFGNPDIQPYLDADISVRAVEYGDLVPTQTYFYKQQLEVMRELESHFNKLGIDFLSHDGFVTYRVGDLKYTLGPPIVEVVDGAPLLIDGMHRAVYAGRKKGAAFKAVFVRGVPKDLKPSVLALPHGWSDIAELDDAAPAGFVKRYKRYSTDLEYKYYFRKYQFPGDVKIIRSGTSIDFEQAGGRIDETQNLRNERERKWVLPKYVLPGKHSYLIKKERIAQGYLPTGSNLSLNGNILSISGKPSLALGDENLNGVRTGILDCFGNFPDDSEFRYRFRNGMRLATFKGGSSNAGRDRPQVEFEIKRRDYDLLRGLAAEEIQKTRVIIPDGKGAIEIDFYDRPDLSFVSIEREFAENENPAGYALPNWLARLHPIDVTNDKSFKNKNLTIALDDGRLAANARFDHIVRSRSHE
jgi:CYTH domain-containing protein